jgi:hypothetical protein
MLVMAVSGRSVMTGEFIRREKGEGRREKGRRETYRPPGARE